MSLLPDKEGSSAHSGCSVKISSQPLGSSCRDAQIPASPFSSARNRPEQHAGWRVWRQPPSTNVSCGKSRAQTPTVLDRHSGESVPTPRLGWGGGSSGVTQLAGAAASWLRLALIQRLPELAQNFNPSASIIGQLAG